MARRANEGRLRVLAEAIRARPGLTAEDGRGRLAHFESATGEPEPDGIPSAPSAGQTRTWLFWRLDIGGVGQTLTREERSRNRVFPA